VRDEQRKIRAGRREAEHREGRSCLERRGGPATRPRPKRGKEVGAEEAVLHGRDARKVRTFRPRLGRLRGLERP